MDQLLDAVNFETSKESIQFMIRALIAKDLIKKLEPEKRRNARRVLYEATELGRGMVQIGSAPLSSVSIKDGIVELDFDFEEL